MSITLVVGLFHLLLLLMNPATEGRNVDEDSGAAAVARQPALAEDRTLGDDEDHSELVSSKKGGLCCHQSELVSRRRWYSDNGEQLGQWNDNDMQWLKRDADKRGWGNGIPPWLRRRVIVGQYQIARR